jgi:lipopolysaccharide export LptBFGC system permease protein LptF
MRRRLTRIDLSRALMLLGVLIAVAFFVFVLSGHGEGTGLLGVMSFVIFVWGATWNDGSDPSDTDQPS